MSDQQATSAAAWPGLAEVVELPSGGRARLKRVSVLAMIRNGTVPNPLLRVAIRVSGAPVPDDPDDPEQEGGEPRGKVTAQDTLRFMGHLIAHAFVEPRVTLDVDEHGQPVRLPGCLHLDDLSDEDQRFVLTFAMGNGARELDAAEPFRGEPASADGGGDGRGVRDTAELAAGAV